MNSRWIIYMPAIIRKQIEGRETVQKIISNSGWLFADNIIRLSVGLFINAWVARYLGPENYGRLNYSIAFVVLFAPFATLGLDSIVVRDIIRTPSATNEILGSAFLLKLAGGVVSLLVSLGCILLVRPQDGITHWLVGIIAAGAVFQSLDTIGFWYQSNYASKFTVYARNTAFILISVLKVILIKSEAPLIAFAWAALVEVVVGSIGLVVTYRMTGNSPLEWSARLDRVQKLLGDSWPLILSGIAIFIQARIDQVMLGEMIGNREVGQYSVAMSLIEVFAFIPMVVQSSLAPAVTQAKIVGEKQYFNCLLNLYRLMSLLFVVIAFPIFLFAKKLVVLVYGIEYQAAGVLLSLFAVRLFFANMGVAKSLYITNENLFRYSLITAVIGSCVNVLLNYVLIPVYASVGAIWAMIISFFVTTFVIDIFYSEVHKNLKVMIKGIITPWKLRLG